MISTDTNSYFTLDSAIEQAICDDRRRNHVNPYRAFDENVIRRQDNRHDIATLTRSAYGRDIEKIINVPAYNRYADKTQVFSFVQNDDLCRRGLHVQLVSRIARNIGSILGLNTELIEAIALGHDLGHTPFGHAGEHFLGKIYHAHTGRYFNHNVHSVRVIDKLYRRNISLQTLDGILCHNGEFAQQVLKLGQLTSFEQLDNLLESCYQDKNTIATLRPSTLEGCVVRISDMISYLGKDRQDALDRGIIDSIDVFDGDIIGRDNARMINNLTVDIINNSYGRDHIAMSQLVFDDLKRAKAQNYEKIYLNEGVIADSGNIVEEMFSEMFEKLHSDCVSGNENSPLFKHHVNNLVSKSKTIKPKDYLIEDSHQIIVDYMASMTDSYFIALYSYLFPKSEKHILSQNYCSNLI